LRDGFGTIGALASGPALVFIQAEIGAVVRARQGRRIRLPDLTDELT
jgi:hypothetical protein